MSQIYSSFPVQPDCKMLIMKFQNASFLGMIRIFKVMFVIHSQLTFPAKTIFLSILGTVYQYRQNNFRYNE